MVYIFVCVCVCIRRYGPVQSVTPQSSGCATVAFIDIRSAAKAFTSPDNLIDDHVIKTQYCEPPASSTASAIYIHDTRDDVLSRPATNSHNSSGSSTSSAVSVTGSAFPQSGGRSSGRHSLLTPATRSYVFIIIIPLTKSVYLCICMCACMSCAVWLQRLCSRRRLALD